MSVSHALAKNTIIQLVGKAISTALGMVAIAVMTRTLGAEQFGWYVTAFGFLQFIGLISDFGFTVTTSNLLAEPGFNRRDILDVCFSWRFVSAIVFQLAAPFIILFFPYRAEIKVAVAIATVSFFALALTQVFIGSFREGLKIHIPVIAELVGRLILVDGVLLLAYRPHSFLPIIGVIATASVATAVYMGWHARPLRFNFDKTISRALWAKLAPTAITVILNAVYLQGDRLLLPLYVDQTTVGYYGASYRVLDIIIQVAALIMGLIMPLITFAWSRNLAAEFRERLGLGFTTLALLMVPMATGVIVLARPIITFVAGPDFAPAASLLALLTISMFGVVFGMAFGHVLLAINRQRQTIWVYASCAALSLAGYLLFIPRYGALGAVGVTVFSEWYTGLLLLMLTYRYARETPSFVPLLKIGLAALLMALVLFPLRTEPLFLTLPLGIVVYGLAAALFGVLKPKQVREFLSSLVASKGPAVLN